MALKRFFVVALFATAFLVGSTTCFAQISPIGGKVFMTVDGKRQPVEGVNIACYRTDIKTGCGKTKTNGRGEFVIGGVPIGGKVILGISGPNLAPTYTPETPVGSKGSERLVIEVFKGDGRVATEEEVRAAAIQTTGELTAEQKKAIEELEKKRAEIEANNQKIENRNALRTQYMEEGVAAYEKKEYDIAIEKFKAGYELDPDFVGSAPGFLVNLAASHKSKAVNIYNSAAKSKVAGAVSKARPEVAKDFSASLKAALEANRIASNAKPDEIVNASITKANIKESNALIAESYRVLGKIRMTLTENVSTVEEANAAVETYKSSLILFPKNHDILAGLTLALYYSASFSGDENQKQESINYGAKYLESADAKHSLREAITEIVAAIKSEGLTAKPMK